MQQDEQQDREGGGVPPADLDEEQRHDRSEGGDAQPAGSIADREAVAADDDELVDGDDE